MFQQSSFYSANRVRMSIGPLTLTPFRTRPVASGMSTSNPARIKASLIWRAKEKSSPVIDIVSIPTLRCDLPNSRQASAISSTSFSLTEQNRRYSSLKLYSKPFLLSFLVCFRRTRVSFSRSFAELCHFGLVRFLDNILQ